MFVTAEGHPYAIFRRAIRSGNLLRAEAAARELGRLRLDDALELLLLIGAKAPKRYDLAARRWLVLLASERTRTLAEVQLAAAALSAGHERAAPVLRAMVRGHGNR
jgi:hypothetical protein